MPRYATQTQEQILPGDEVEVDLGTETGKVAGYVIESWEAKPLTRVYRKPTFCVRVFINDGHILFSHAGVYEDNHIDVMHSDVTLIRHKQPMQRRKGVNQNGEKKEGRPEV